MARKWFSLALVAALSVSCATVRLEYRTDLELPEGEVAEAVYTRSYDTSGHMIACIITAVAYGGWCWAYAFMPFASQDRLIKDDAEGFIRKQVGKDFSTGRIRITKRGYGNLPLEKEITVFEDEEELAEEKRGMKKKETTKRTGDNSRQKAEETLRDMRWKNYQQSVQQFQRGTFQHYGAFEAHFTGFGIVYGKSLRNNLHFNFNYFSARPDNIFTQTHTRLTDIEATLRLHLGSFYARFGAGYRNVEFTGGENGSVWFDNERFHLLGSVSSLGGVGAIGLDVTDGSFFYGVEFLRLYSPWSKLSSNLKFAANDSTSATQRQKFEDAAWSEGSGDLLKVKFGFVIQ